MDDDLQYVTDLDSVSAVKWNETTGPNGGELTGLVLEEIKELIELLFLIFRKRRKRRLWS